MILKSGLDQPLREGDIRAKFEESTRTNQGALWRKSILGRGRNKGKGPEVGICPVCWRNSRECC